MPGLADLPLLTAEFLAVDTETNGLAREACELTEVGAVLVGGGELHERWSSLVGVEQPLGRGIQRFTGISQAMVDAAPPPSAVLPGFAEQLKGRVLVAHNARFDTRVLQQAFERAGLEWPDPPVLCTVALARRLAPLQRRRGLAALADALGIEVAAVHRALPDAETCARVFCALFPKLCAHAGTIGEALALLRPKRAARKPSVASRSAAPRHLRPDMSAAAEGPGRLRLPRRRRAPAVRRQVGLPADARAGALHDAGGVDGRCRARRLPTHALRARSARAREPADQGAQAAGQQEAQEDARRLRLPALPARHPLPDPRGRARAGARPQRHDRAAARAGRRGGARRAAQLAVLAAPLRAQAAAARPSVRLRADGPLPLALPAATSTRTSTASGSTPRSASSRATDGGASLLAHIDGQMRAAAAEQRFERAAWLRRRHARLRTLLERLGGVLRAIHAGSRLVLAAHPTDDGAPRRVLDRRRPRRRLGRAAGGPRRARRPHRRRAARRAAAGARRLAAPGRDRRGAHRRPVARGARGARARADARDRPARARGAAQRPSARAA